MNTVLTLEAAIAQLDASDRAAASVPTTPCPPWCELPAGHPWTADITPGAVCRVHAIEVYRSAPGLGGYVITIDQYEGIDATGVRDIDLVRVNTSDEPSDDPEVQQAAADALVVAKARLTEIRRAGRRAA